MGRLTGAGADIPEGLSEDEWETAEITYLVGRDDWLAEHAAGVMGAAAAFSCVLVVPGAAPHDHIYFDEFDGTGKVCGARRHSRSAYAFGSPATVIASVAGVPEHDPWVRAVLAAVERDRGRFCRPQLEVQPGRGQLVHFSASANRESISRWGLDWRRMGASWGIAGSTAPELAAVFLDSAGPHSLFRRMARTTIDRWGVDVTGLWIENGPSGWYIHGAPIPPERLELLERDLAPEA